MVNQFVLDGGDDLIGHTLKLLVAGGSLHRRRVSRETPASRRPPRGSPPAPVQSAVAAENKKEKCKTAGPVGDGVFFNVEHKSLYPGNVEDGSVDVGLDRRHGVVCPDHLTLLPLQRLENGLLRLLQHQTISTMEDIHSFLTRITPVMAI